MGRNENLICEILQIIESNPYCDASAITLKGYDCSTVLNQLMLIHKEHLILAEPEVDENGEAVKLFNIHLTLRGLIFLKKFSSMQIIS